MRLKEQKLWDRMRRGVGVQLLMERVENMLDKGFPDVILQDDVTSATVFAELKSVNAFPARENSRVFGADGLSVDQRNWAKRFTDRGGRLLIIASVGHGAKAEHYAVPGCCGDEFNSFSRRELSHFAVAHEVGAAFWNRLVNEIRSGREN